MTAPEPLCNKAQMISQHWALIIFLYTSQVQAQHRAVTVTAGEENRGEGGYTMTIHPHPPPHSNPSWWWLTNKGNSKTPKHTSKWPPRFV